MIEFASAGFTWGDLGAFAALIAIASAIVGAVILAPRAFKVAQLRADITAKDETIQTKDQSIAALTQRVDDLQREVQHSTRVTEDAKADQQRLGRELIDARARYEEALKYTAQPAFTRLETAFRFAFEQMGEREERSTRALETVAEALKEVKDHLDNRMERRLHVADDR